MNSSKKYRQVLLYLLYFVIIVFLVFLSPRFGYKIIDETGSPRIYKFDKLINRDASMKEAVYISKDGSILTLLYESRFSKDIVIEKNNKVEYSYSINLDGAITSSFGTDSKLKFILHNIISNDSGAFYFIAFLKPLLFSSLCIIFSEASKNKLKLKTVKLQKFIATLSFIISVLFALRII